MSAIHNFRAYLHPGMERLIRAEARRISKDKVEQASVQQHAPEYVTMAHLHGLSANNLVLARVAAEMAHDRVTRIQFVQHLGATPATRWWWKRIFGRRRNTIHEHVPSSSDDRLPISYMDYDDLVAATEKYASKVGGTNRVEPFAGLKPTWIWAMDAMRPPVQAIRYTAHLIDKNLGKPKLSEHERDDLGNFLLDLGEHLEAPKLKVLGLELGHSIGAQALSVFLPYAEVHAGSLVYDIEPEVEAGKADAVVVNLPNAACAGFAKMVQDRAKLMQPYITRADCSEWRHWPSSEPWDEWEHVVQAALGYLTPGGLLVLLGDSNSGVHHHASKVIDDAGLVPVKLTADRKPVLFVYPKPPWGPLDAMPATNRLVSAWRRR